MVGSVVRAINSGLGNLTWEFARHGLIDKSLIVDDRADAFFPERFDNSRVARLPFTDADIKWLLEGIDTLLIFETPYSPKLIPEAKRQGIKVVFMPMHEFPPDKRGVDIWLCPSDLELKIPLDGEKIRLNVPVDTERVEWKKRDRAITFIHNAGGGGVLGRNGTNELISALKYTDKDFELIIRSQVNKYEVTDPRVTILHQNLENYWDLWKYGDVFVLPDKFAGLSLPLQEAYASGMLIMTTNRDPLNTWLPNEPLIPIESYGRGIGYDVAIIDPKNIAETIDKWYNKDITEFSERGRAWGQENSWKKLLPKYKAILYG